MNEETIDSLRERAERAERACAEMRVIIDQFAQHNIGNKALFEKALNTTIGQSYVCQDRFIGYLSPAEVREVVKPLVEALKFCDDCLITGNFGCVQNVMSYAREKGWIV